MKPLPKLTMALMLSALVGCGRGKNSAAGKEATVADLNRAVAALTMMNGRCPASVSELTNFPLLQGKTLPVPPAGKKLVIDPATRQVVIADQGN
jgi:hypothetical protein